MASVVALLVTLGLLDGAGAGHVAVESFVGREVAFSATVTCDAAIEGGTLHDVRCVAAIPESTPRQDVVLQWISPGARLLRDEFGNLILAADRDALAEGDAVDLGWRARVRLRAAIHYVDPTRLASPLATPKDVLVRYLADGEAYRVDDPVLRAVALSARDAAGDPLDLAFRLNEAVRERLAYDRDTAWDAAPAVWRRQTGSCSEYCFVFVALCRIAGLPARYVGASALRSGDDDYVDTVFHRWSEVWLPGYGWYPVDVSRNDCEDGGLVNEAFGCTNVNLLELMRGDGGDHQPLGWSYVANVRGRADDGSAMRMRRRITWSPAPKEELPPLPLATLLGR